MITVRLQAEPFDPGAALAPLAQLDGGGIASFTGWVRGEGGLTELLLEHHPRMTLTVMESLAEAAAARWALLGLVLIHRHGPLAPGAPIVLVGTAARHRGAALDACAFLIDRLKTEAPFWKRETFADGRVRWVEPRVSDTAAAERWDAPIAEAPPTL
jgi:molybdopterin synthase catalytic subunit